MGSQVLDWLDVIKKRSQTPLQDVNKGREKTVMLNSEKQQEIANRSEALLDWATEYFENHKEILKLMGINSVDELVSRVLDLVKKYSGKWLLLLAAM